MGLQVLHDQTLSSKELPPVVVALLEDKVLTFAGIGIKGDCTRIGDFFGVTVANAVDIATLAQMRKMPLERKRGLAELCSNLLGRRLSKDPAVTPTK